jgi:hypothetical protein
VILLIRLGRSVTGAKAFSALADGDKKEALRIITVGSRCFIG